MKEKELRDEMVKVWGEESLQLSVFDSLLKKANISLIPIVPDSVYQTKVQDLDLSVRLSNVFRREGIETVADVIELSWENGFSKFRKFKHCGIKTVCEIQWIFLNFLDLTFKDFGYDSPMNGWYYKDKKIQDKPDRYSRSTQVPKKQYRISEFNGGGYVIEESIDTDWKVLNNRQGNPTRYLSIEGANVFKKYLESCREK